MGFTYVTAFLELPGTRVNPVDFIEKFLVVARSGVPLILYTSGHYAELCGPALEGLPNVRLGGVVELADTWTWATLTKETYNLPAHRNEEKDTLAYMACQHTKMEFMWKAAQDYPDFHTYAWIDFRVAHVFKNIDQSLAELAHIAKTYEDVRQDSLAIFPGCWSAGVGSLTEGICWRFCGGFFLLSRTALERIWTLIQHALPQFLEKERVATWEVNFWAYLERSHDWSPRWYKADHNDTLIHVPPLEATRAIVSKRVDVDAQLLNLNPMNSSYIEHRGVRILNVRCVNYKLTPSGTYIIDDVAGIIRTRNLLCVLDKDYNVFFSNEVAVNIDLPSKDDAIQGLEDIRLFAWKDALYYIATQRQWSACGRNRMIMGRYSHHITEETIIHPPSDSACEKNWIPYCSGSSANPDLRFIYTWHPYSVGVVDETTSTLRITSSTVYPGLFRHLKGSTVPVDYKDHAWTLAHYTIEGSPRTYYHVVVLLDRATLAPAYISQPFYFERVGVEYCIGMTIEDERMYCWVSRHDRDPCLMVLPVEQFQLVSLT